MSNALDIAADPLTGLIGSVDANTVGQTIRNTYLGNNNSDSSDYQAASSSTVGKIPASEERNPAFGGTSSFYQSPAHVSRAFTDLGKFFSGGEPGNMYTNRYQQPQATQAPRSEKPSDFYNRWYEAMRNFSQAEETASKGQTQIRTR